MQSFTNKAKVDTNAILRHDAIRTFFERIDNNCFDALRLALKKTDCGYTHENVSLTQKQIDEAMSAEN